MTLSFKIEMKKGIFEKALIKVHRDQLPYVYSRALNATAFDVRKEIINKAYPKAFNIRSKSLPRVSTTVLKSNKRNLVASVGDFKTNPSSFLVKHAEGGEKLPKGRFLAIPISKIKRTSSGRLAHSEKPRTLLSKKKAVILTFNGKRMIAVRNRKEQLLVKYVLKERAQIKKTLPFYETAEKIIQEKFNSHFWFYFSKTVNY